MAGVKEQKSALWRRQEQLDRWNNSDTNKEKAELRSYTKVKFQDGCVFLAACSSGDKHEVERLLAKQADINTSNIDGLTALHQACIDDNIDMVQFLVEHGADVNVCDNEGWTALHATASCGYLDVAEYLMQQGADIAAVNNDGELAFDLADGEDMEDLLCEEMERQGIDADAARREEEETMLADANQWLNSDKLNVEEERHPNTGATPLHVAAAKGYIKVMNLLLEAGADLDATDHDGWTPLHAAAHWGQEEACKVLVENFCNIDAKNTAGQTAFDVVDPDITKLLEELKEKQATLKKDRKELEVIYNRAPPPLKRRSSVTRMSVDQKQSVILKNVEEEGAHLKALLNKQLDEKEEKEEKTSSSSGSEEVSSASDSETEKHNEINRKTTLTANIQENGTASEQPQVVSSTPKIEDTPGLKPPPPKVELTPRVSDTPDLIQTEQPQVVPTPEETKKKEIKDLVKEKEKDKPTIDEKIPAEDGVQMRIKENGDSEDPPSSKPSTSPVKVETGKKGDDPGSWRAGLRKTGSTSTVPETTSIRERDSSDRLARSASSPWLAPEKHSDDYLSSRTRPTSTSSALGDNQEAKNRFTDFYSKYLLNASNTGPASSTSTSTTTPYQTPYQSSYVPHSRRRQLDRDKDAASTTMTTTTTTTTLSTTKRRSYEPPKRDEERETERKARAKRARETRRSTQGVSKEDLEMAEKTLHAADKGEEPPGERLRNRLPLNDDTRNNNKENKPEESYSMIRRRTYDDKKDAEDSRSSYRRSRDAALSSLSSTTTADTTTPSISSYRSLRNSTTSVPDTTSSLPGSTALTRSSSYRSRYLREREDEQKEKEEKKEEKEEKDKEDPSQKSSAIRARRKRSDRRPTGKITLEDIQGSKDDDSEKDKENKIEDKKYLEPTTGSRYSSRYSDSPLYDLSYDRYSGLGSRSTSDRPSSYSSSSYAPRSYQTSDSTSKDSTTKDSTSQESKDKDGVDYKKLFEEQKSENQKLKKEVHVLQDQLTKSKLECERIKNCKDTSKSNESLQDKRERRALERKLSEMEEELRTLESFKADNQRLKEENGALIRVISKLSK